MRGTKKLALILPHLLILLGLYFFSGAEEGKTFDYKVLDVVDGDTVIIDDANKSHVRYLGIDTPEIAKLHSPGEPLAKEALEFNKKLVGGKSVRIEFDKEKYDAYGRKLAYVYVDGILVSQELVANGLATALFIKPNMKRKDIINDALRRAKRNKRGIWGDPATLNYPSRNRQFIIDATDASRYNGKRVVVRGRVSGARISNKVLVLSMNGEFDAVIFRDDWANFEFFDIYPSKYYNGREVEVIGRVKMYKGTPGIIVDHPIQIRRVD